MFKLTSTILLSLFSLLLLSLSCIASDENYSKSVIQQFSYGLETIEDDEERRQSDAWQFYGYNSKTPHHKIEQPNLMSSTDRRVEIERNIARYKQQAALNERRQRERDYYNLLRVAAVSGMIFLYAVMWYVELWHGFSIRDYIIRGLVWIVTVCFMMTILSWLMPLVIMCLSISVWCYGKLKSLVLSIGRIRFLSIHIHIHQKQPKD